MGEGKREREGDWERAGEWGLVQGLGVKGVPRVTSKGTPRHKLLRQSELWSSGWQGRGAKGEVSVSEAKTRRESRAK